jgi:hypothetical protein
MPLTLAMTAPLLIVTHKVSNHHLRHEWQLSKLIEKYGNFCGTKTLCYEFFFVHILQMEETGLERLELGVQ